MSTFSSIIAGFGGQGSLLMGKIMAYAGMLEGKEVSWCPSYGPEMRGGTANVNVIISDENVGSPVVTKDADCIVALNQPSLDKFVGVVKEGGALVVNADLCTVGAVKDGVKVYAVPANKIATDNFGGSKLANLVMLGAVVYATGAMILQVWMKHSHMFLKAAKQNSSPTTKKHLSWAMNMQKICNLIQ